MGVDAASRNANAAGSASAAAQCGAAPGKGTLIARDLHGLTAAPSASSAPMTGSATDIDIDVPIAAESPAIEHTISQCELATQQGLEHAKVVLASLMPAYSQAADALDGQSAQEIGLQIVRGFSVADQAKKTLDDKLPALEAAGHVFSRDFMPTEDDLLRIDALRGEKAGLDASVTTLWTLLSWRLGPQSFRDRLVMGGIEAAPAEANPAQRLAYEVMQVAALIQTVHDVAALVPATAAPNTSEPLPDDVSSTIARKVAAWKGRPVNFAFLKAALTELGLWDRVSGASAGPRVRYVDDPSAPEAKREEFDEAIASLAQVDHDVTEQANATGATGDVGTFDADRVYSLLVPGDRNQEVASEVLRMLMSAGSRARGRLVRQIHRMGRLEVLCQSIGYVATQQLYESIDLDEEDAAELLRPYYEGKVDNIGKSNTRRLDDAIDGSGGVEHYGLGALRWVYHTGTFGFAEEHDEAYDEREQGFISTEDYHQAARHALIKAALVGGAATVTGGAFGELAGGETASLVAEYAGKGVGDFAGGVAEGTVGGSTGAVAGHVTHDLAGIALGDQDSMSSLGDYANTALEGAKFGGALSLVGGLSVEAAKHLPEGVKTRAQALGARLSAGADAAFNPIRQLGRGARAVVRLSVEQVNEWIAAKILPPDAMLQLSAASVGPSSLVSMEVQATDALDGPAADGGKAPLQVINAYSAADADAAAANVSTPGDAVATAAPTPSALPDPLKDFLPGGNVSATVDGKPLPSNPIEAQTLRDAGLEYDPEEIRGYYLAEAAKVDVLNEQWVKEGISAEHRAQLAYDIRHNARVTARAMESDSAGVEQLRSRDLKKYGNPDGPTFDWLVAKAKASGIEGDAIYDDIIGSSQRTDGATNAILGVTGKDSRSGHVAPVPPREPRGPSTTTSASRRPSWQESERRVSEDVDWADFDDQRSFIDGKDVPRGTPGSTRPDNYSATLKLSVDVKNYDISSSAGRSRLVQNVVGQMKERAAHLPPGTRQGVVIDARGQSITAETQSSLRDRIVRGAGGMVHADDVVILAE